MPESIQQKLGRVRPPRVHITYEVETGGAIVMKELPFVMGILADLSGKPDEALPKLKDRKFTEIDRDNFNTVMKAAKPRLAYRVDNKMTDDDTKLGVELRFQNLDDFHPEQVANQVEPLKKLLDARKRLSDLLSKMDGNDKLVEALQDVIGNTEMLKKLGAETGVEPAGKTPPEEK